MENTEKQTTVKKNKGIKLKDFYKQIGITKTLNFKYAGVYKDFSAYIPNHVYVFFNVKTEEKRNINHNKIIEHAWGFKEGYVYEFGFNELGEMISIRNRDYYLCYFEKPNKIYFINFKKEIRTWINKPIGKSSKPSIEPIIIKVGKIKEF